jgi:hypothetical protein
MSAWHYYAVCPCGMKFRAPDGEIFFVFVECCPECGERKPHTLTTRIGKASWKILRMRWVSTAKLFSPRTWFTGHWEIHPEDQR